MKRATLRRATALFAMLFVLAAQIVPITAEGTNEWHSFGGNDENMAVTDAKTPRSAAETRIKWAQQFSSGWANPVTPPIIANGYMYAAKGKSVLKIDISDGRVLASSEDLSGSLGYTATPITYADGMLFAQIGNGQIEALNADSLESLWVSESLSGQTLCPITYRNGRIFTGSWNGDTNDGYYFCLTTADIPNDGELKAAEWSIANSGGFYWAGAYAAEGFVVFGGNGGKLFSVNPETGETLDIMEDVDGDVRSTVSYDAATDSIYFSTKNGYLYKLQVNYDGTFNRSSTELLYLGGAATGTPTVYDGLAYIGVSGANQFSSDGHSCKVIDVNTSPMKEVFSAETPGYVQSSLLVSSSYGSKVYAYATYNYSPGGIYVMEIEKTSETDEDGAAIVSVHSSSLFAPKNEMSSPSLCSPVCDSEGTIYYKNDSGYIMALSKADESEIKTVSLEISDYTAATYGSDKASESGIILSTDVTVPSDAMAIDAITTALEAARIPYVLDSQYLYITSLNSLSEFDCGAMSGWCFSKNDSFDNLGIAQTEIFGGDRLRLDYTVSGGEDVGMYWQSLPKITEFILSGTVGKILGGEGTKAAPYTITLPSVASGLSVAEVKSTLHPKYISYSSEMTDISKECDYTKTVDFCLQTPGGFLKAYYRVNTDSSSGGSSDTIKSYYPTDGLSFNLGESETAGSVTVSFEDYGERVGDVELSTALGTIILPTKVPYREGDSIADVTVRLLNALGIEYAATGTTEADFYLTSIKNFHLSDGSAVSSFGEFDAGQTSGWMASLNSWFINKSSSEMTVHSGDEIEWRYTCQSGSDIGCDMTNPSAKITDISFKKNYGTLSPSFSSSVKEYTYTVSSNISSVCLEALLENYCSRVTYTCGNKEYRPMSEIPVGNSTVITIKSTYAGEPTDEDMIKITIKKSAAAQPSGNSSGGDSDSSVSAAVSAAIASSVKSIVFSDVSNTAWYYDSVMYVLQNKLMSGTADKIFEPDTKMTRGMLVTVLYRMENEPNCDLSSFSDVSEDSYYAKAVGWGVSVGILNGITEKTFAPNDTITREQLAAIMFRYAKYKNLLMKDGASLEKYSDESSISAWAKEAFTWAVGDGIITGTTENTLSPQDTATRAQVAAILMRFCEGGE